MRKKAAWQIQDNLTKGVFYADFRVSELRSKNIEIYYSVGIKDGGSQTRDIQALDYPSLLELSSLGLFNIL